MTRFIDQTEATPITGETIIVIGIVFVVGKRLDLLNSFLTFDTLMQLHGLIIRKFLFSFIMAFRTKNVTSYFCSSKDLLIPLSLTIVDNLAVRRIVLLHWFGHYTTNNRNIPDDTLVLCTICIEYQLQSHCHNVYNVSKYVCDIVHMWNLPRLDRNCHSMDFGISRILNSFDDKFCHWRWFVLPFDQNFDHTNHNDRRNVESSLEIKSDAWRMNINRTASTMSEKRRYEKNVVAKLE